jgi:hypothetical protein
MNSTIGETTEYDDMHLSNIQDEFKQRAIPIPKVGRRLVKSGATLLEFRAFKSQNQDLEYLTGCSWGLESASRLPTGPLSFSTVYFGLM